MTTIKEAYFIFNVSSCHVCKIKSMYTLLFLTIKFNLYGWYIKIQIVFYNVRMIFIS